jgi:hypothetical protein
MERAKVIADGAQIDEVAARFAHSVGDRQVGLRDGAEKLVLMQLIKA